MAQTPEQKAAAEKAAADKAAAEQVKADEKANADAEKAAAKTTKVVHFKCEKYPDLRIGGGESILSFEGGRFQSKDADTIERIRNCATYQEGTIVEYDPKKEVAAEDDAE